MDLDSVIRPYYTGSVTMKIPIDHVTITNWETKKSQGSRASRADCAETRLALLKTTDRQSEHVPTGRPFVNRLK